MARITGDGSKVSFAWYAAKGATGYEVLRSRDARNDVTTLARLPGGTLGYEDRQPLAGSAYYQVVAVGADGGRAPTAWLLYSPPVVTGVVADAADVVVTWSAVASAPGGYEIWRTRDTHVSPARVGAVSSSTLTYRDKQAGAGPFYYRVVARGAGGATATSPWFAFAGSAPAVAASTPATAARAAAPGALSDRPAAAAPVGIAAQGKAGAAPVDLAPATPVSAIAAAGSSPITDLKVTGATATSVSLSWSAVPGAVGYRVYHGLIGTTLELAATQQGAGQAARLATTTVAGLQQFMDVGLNPDSAYGFEVSPVYPSPPQPVGKPSAPNEGARAGPVMGHTQLGAAPSKLAGWFEAAGLPPPAAASATAANAAAAAQLGSAAEVGRTQAQAEATEQANADATLIGAAQAPLDAVLAAAEAAKGLLLSDPATGQVPPSANGAPATYIPLDVHLEWPRVEEAAGYLVFRDGRPLVPTTTPVTATSYLDRDPPPGTHVYSVASVFKTAVHGYVEGNLNALPRVSVPVTYGYYRVVLERIVVNQPTSDTVLDLDGKGDEVFATAHAYVASALAGTTAVVAPTTAGGIRSRTYGDVNNQSNRVRAGSRSAQGGLQQNDSVPETAGPCQTTATAGCLPLEIFRGVLAKNLIGTYLVPRVWEWDGLDLLAVPLDQRLRGAREWLRSELQHVIEKDAAARQQLLGRPSGGVVEPGSLAALLPAGKTSVPLSALVGPGSYGPTLDVKESAQSLVQLDRPIGIASISHDPVALKATYTFDEQVIPLGYELAEALASGTLSVPPLGKGEFVITFVDRDEGLKGIYTLVFVVRKCASLDQC